MGNYAKDAGREQTNRDTLIARESRGVTFLLRIPFC